MSIATIRRSFTTLTDGCRASEVANDMLACPDCGGVIEDLGGPCASCTWQGSRRDGVAVALSGKDRVDPLTTRYLENYDQISHDDLEHDILDEEFVRNRATQMADRMGDVRGLAVCDLGCGRGHLTRALVAGGAHVTAVDIAWDYVRRAGAIDGVRAVLANAENLPFAEEFDALSTTDVMEHVLNVGAFLFSVNRALKPGGRAYIRVPFEESLMQYAPQLGASYQLAHLRSYDKRMLRKQLEDAGFEVERIAVAGFWPNTPQPFWRHGRRSQWYSSLQAWIERHGISKGSVTLWPAWFSRAFMVPLDVIARARKTRTLVSVQPPKAT